MERLLQCYRVRLQEKSCEEYGKPTFACTITSAKYDPFTFFMLVLLMCIAHRTTPLPPPIDTPPSNSADRVQFLMEHCNNTVVLKARSKGDSVPQAWKFQVFGM